MDPRFSLLRTRLRRQLAALALVAAALLAAGLALMPEIRQQALTRAAAQSETTLGLATSGVEAAINRFAPLPSLVAERPILLDVLDDPGNSGLLPFANQLLRQTARAIGASDVYLMDDRGVTVASSNYRDPYSFIGRNFDFRPYFTDALSRGSGRFHALGTTSGERGFFFAAPVLDGLEARGVIAIKMTVGPIEDDWGLDGQDIIVTDPNGIIFLSSRADLRLRTMAPLSDAQVDRIAATRQFPVPDLSLVPAEVFSLGDGITQLDLGDTAFLAVSLPTLTGGWHATVLTPLAPLYRGVWGIYGIFALGVLVLALLALIWLQRAANLADRLALHQRQRSELEDRVAARTRDLSAEVEERRLAEERLKSTQRELVQAGKLAALGQMSAALSHEINQPLAAVKSYAENAGAYLDRGRDGDARQNIRDISDMADRMARISGRLRSFARRPGDKIGPVPVRETLSDALALLEPRLRGAGAQVRVAPGAEVWGQGGRLRLQQVLINLVTNALDAMEAVPDPALDIDVIRDSDSVCIRVRDHGPGLSAVAEAQAFEAFFTTKEAGSGLGLGLSISFNIIQDFGGSLSARNHPDGGAEFTVRLVAGQPETLGVAAQ